MENRYLLQLMLSRGIGDAAVKKILHYARAHGEESLEQFFKAPIRLQEILNCKEETLQSVFQNESRAKALSDEIRDNGIRLITENDGMYPQRLKEVLEAQCPPVLFLKGNPALLAAKAVGFCGSRKVSPKGVVIAEQCASQLAERGITVVSGYAAGTDLAAHTSAMRHDGSTVFVLAEGLLKSSEKAAVRDLLTDENHVFVSQFLPNQVWNVGSAMKRNSVIIGLSKAMILVESGKTGGTFAAGEESLKRGVPLFVIDYAKPEVSAEANPYFLEKGGLPIRGKDGVPVLEKVFSAVEADGIGAKPEQLTIGI